MVGDHSGRSGVERRSMDGSRIQYRLRKERARHREDMIGEGLVEEILSLKESNAVDPQSEEEAS